MKFSLSLCLILLPSIAFADARNGELFGYKIGDVYPVTESTMGQRDWFNNLMTIYPENPKKPKDIGKVVVGVTLKSFAFQYKEILRAKYKVDFNRWDSPMLQNLLLDPKVIKFRKDMKIFRDRYN